MRSESRRRSPSSRPRASRSNLGIALPSILQPCASASFAQPFLDARSRKIHHHSWPDHDGNWSCALERVHAEVARPFARRYPDRRETLRVLLPDRHLHHSQHCSEPAVFLISEIAVIPLIFLMFRLFAGKNGTRRPRTQNPTWSQRLRRNALLSPG